MSQDPEQKAPETRSPDRLRASPIQDLADAQSALTQHIDGLERELRRLNTDREDKARLGKLQEAVADLASGHHDVHRQLDALVALVDLLGDDSSAGDPSQDGQSVANRPRPATFVPPVASRFPRLKRWARAVLRTTLGKARHLWDTTHPRPPWGDDLRRVMGGTPAKLPSLVVVLPTDEARTATAAGLDRQTDPNFERLGPGEGISSDYIWQVVPGQVPPTFVESARLLLATEDLAFACFETEASEAPGGVISQWIVSRELCDNTGRLDLRVLSRWAKRHPNRVLGKIIGGDDNLLPRALCRPRVRRRVRRSGPYVLSVSTRPRTVDHRLTRPDAGLVAEETQNSGPLVLVTAELAGGLDRVVAGILEGTSDTAQPVLASLAPQGFWSTRWRALELFTPFVYDLGGIFAGELHEDLLEALITRHKIHRLVPVGGAIWPDLVAKLQSQFPALQITEPASTLPIDSERVTVDPEDRHRVRADLGVEPETLLVVMCADLIAGQRPEDFISLAHRFRSDDRFTFLLVGEGPLGSDVRDLERLLSPGNLRIEAPCRKTSEILAAADIVCTTAESDPFPLTVYEALRHSRPVVAAAAGTLPKLLAGGPCGIVIPHAGDLDSFEDALRSLTDGKKRRELGDRGPATLRDFLKNNDA